MSTALNAAENIYNKPKSTKEALEYQNKITERLYHGKATTQPPKEVETDDGDESDMKGEPYHHFSFELVKMFGGDCSKGFTSQEGCTKNLKIIAFLMIFSCKFQSICPIQIIFGISSSLFHAILKSCCDFSSLGNFQTLDKRTNQIYK